MKQISMILWLSLVTLFLAGCGGGSSSNSDMDSVQIAPIADAGIDQNVTTKSTVELDGSNSYDSNDDPLTYVWNIVSKPNNSNTSLSDTSIAKPTFVVDVSGTYEIQLIVNDGSVDSEPDIVIIKASSLIYPPTPPSL